MTNTQLSQFDRLFELAKYAQEFDEIDLKFVCFWESLREDHGLAKLLELVREYCQRNQVQTIADKLNLIELPTENDEIS